jgi:hypothetical protein
MPAQYRAILFSDALMAENVFSARNSFGVDNILGINGQAKGVDCLCTGAERSALTIFRKKQIG